NGVSFLPQTLQQPAAVLFRTPALYRTTAWFIIASNKLKKENKNTLILYLFDFRDLAVKFLSSYVQSEYMGKTLCVSKFVSRFFRSAFTACVSRWAAPGIGAENPQDLH
ncbi:MAG: hypothetical protein LBK13_02730, partial [Spirochaetales bacterium]|nr:hypothetical protein [Spirochaetales bacterium]